VVGWRMRTARVVMFAQAVASLGIWVVQVLATSVRLGHNQDVPGTVWLVLVTNPVITALVALAAVFLTRRRWARGLAVAMETVGVVSALVSVSTGFYQALIAIALAIGVITLVTTSSPRPAHAA
jgi:glucan phosphoethanolaminetransferase (alkaline phosphatase superfamily)